MLVDFATVPDGVKRDKPFRMVDPKQDAIVAGSTFVKAGQPLRQVAKRFGEVVWMCGQLFELSPHTLCNRFVELAERALEVRS